MKQFNPALPGGIDNFPEAGFGAGQLVQFLAFDRADNRNEAGEASDTSTVAQAALRRPSSTRSQSVAAHPVTVLMIASCGSAFNPMTMTSASGGRLR